MEKLEFSSFSLWYLPCPIQSSYCRQIDTHSPCTKACWTVSCPIFKTCPTLAHLTWVSLSDEILDLTNLASTLFTWLNFIHFQVFPLKTLYINSKWLLHTKSLAIHQAKSFHPSKLICFYITGKYFTTTKIIYYSFILL